MKSDFRGRSEIEFSRPDTAWFLIFLYVPDTDTAAYGRSIEKLAKLVPELDLLLPAHNFPVAKPEMLERLADAFRQVQSGKARFTLTGGRREYRFDGFSLLLAGDKK